MARLAIHYSVHYNNTLLEIGVVNHPDDAAVTVELPCSGSFRLVSFRQEVEDFLNVRAESIEFIRTEKETVEKLGSAVQLSEVFIIRLSKKPISDFSPSG